MAISSFVLVSNSVMCLGLFAGIPAIILGHMAYSRTRKAPELYGGSGLAIAGFVMGYASILTTLILAGLTLPALAKAKSKAQSISCVNNLKQIGLAFRIWSTDHNGRFPSNTSTNEAGAVQPAGHADNPEAFTLSVLEKLSDKIGNPRILVCPADPAKHPAVDLADLQEDNVSYEFETGPDVNENNPQQVLARCPIHGHELLCDGSVHQRRWR
jgi:hypothetical protein